MTDDLRGMEGSRTRIGTLLRTALPAVILGGAIAVTGCGGGGGGNSASAPAPVKQSSASGGVVSAEGTLGLVGPSARATAKKQQFDDAKSKIPANAKGKTGAQKHGVAAGADCGNGDLMPDDSNIDQLNASILCLVNAERADNGNLPPLSSNTELEQAAVGMCKLMVSEQFFAHETPEGKTVVDRVEPTGYIPKGNADWVVGENLAWGSGALSTPQAIVNGWMNSPGHKANILAPDYKDVGLAACQGAPSPSLSGGTVYVNDFGAKSGADANVSLPPENGSGTSGSSGNNASAATATVAGTRKAKAAQRKRKRRAACVRHARKINSSTKRKAAVRRCRKT
jgi:uncharacterized protein YkwD